MKPLHYLILEHMNVYGMTIPQAVAQLFGIGNADAEQGLHALESKGLVRSADLTLTTKYFRLQPNAAHVLRVHSVESRCL